MCKCNHNPNSESTDLTLIPVEKMVYPQKYYFYCTKCEKTYCFVRNSEGVFKKIKRKE